MPAPTINDDETKGLGPGVHWLDFDDAEGVADYIAISVSPGAAVWRRVAIAGTDGKIPQSRIPAAAGGVTALELSTALAGLQTQIDGKQPAGSYSPSSHGHAPTDIAGTAVIATDARLTDARTPTAHSHAKADVGLSNVDNIALANAPVSTAQAAADATKAAIVHAASHAPGGADAIVPVTTTSVPLTGQTTTFNIGKNNQSHSLLHLATIAAHTVVIPSEVNSTIGQELKLFSKSIVTTLTTTLNGNTIHGLALTTMTAGANVGWRKVAASTWVRMQ